MFQLRTLRRELDPLTLVQLIAVLVIFLLFMVLPLFSVIGTAFSHNGIPSSFWFVHVFTEPSGKYWPIRIVPGGIDWGFQDVPIELVGETLYIRGIDMGGILNSIMVGLMTTLWSTLIGVALAFIMARYDFFGKTVIRILLLIPMLSTPFVSAVGIQKIWGRDGAINLLFFETLHIMPYRLVLDGLAAVVFVQTLHFFSLTYLSAYSALINIDPTLEESAENMGSKGFQLFRKVTLPLALPGIEAGAILTFILSVEDLGTLVVFQASSQVRKTITYQVFSSIFAPTGEIDPIAPALSCILLLIAIVGFLLIRKYMSLRGYAMLTKGGTWNPRLTKAKWYHYILFFGVIIGILAVALTPHIGIFLLAFSTEWGRTILPTFLTPSNFAILVADPSIFQAIINSLLYSTLAVIIVILLAIGAAYIVARKNIPGKGWLDLLVTIPIALPGIVLAMGYFLFFVRTPIFTYSPLNPLLTISYGLVFFNPGVFYLITMAFGVRKFPFTVRSTFAGLQQTHVEMEEAAQNLGAGRLRTYTRITIPIIASSILAGGMMSFVYSMSEVSTSIVLGGIRPEQAPITWKMYDVLVSVAGGAHAAAVLGILLMVVQIIILAVVNIILKTRTEAMVGL